MRGLGGKPETMDFPVQRYEFPDPLSFLPDTAQQFPVRPLREFWHETRGNSGVSGLGYAPTRL